MNIQIRVEMRRLDGKLRQALGSALPRASAGAHRPRACVAADLRAAAAPNRGTR
jgi:hypothetical protein